MKTKNFAFAVQGEGRGHLTQAIALQEILIRQGHNVCCVIVGSSSNRKIPDFFIRKFSVPVVAVASPNFTIDNKSRAVNLGRTITDNILKIGKFRKSLTTINALLNEHQPDAVINFYEPLVSIHAIAYRCKFTVISIAHQYIYLHRHFRFPAGDRLQALYLKSYTWLTQIGSSLQLAISIYDLPASGNRSLKVCPPLLRREIFTMQPREEDFILVYLLNSGYTCDIVQYHKKYPQQKLICFTDSAEVRDQHRGELKLDDTLEFHSLNDRKFLDLMARCKALVCTAGFESVCEAMYLDKPVMMVPVKGHYEQFCNAMDASRIGAGIYSKDFDLSKLEDCLLIYNRKKNRQFREWVDSFESRFWGALHIMDEKDPIPHQFVKA